MNDATRDRLIAAAQELFASQGVGAVSLREIVRASGARNSSALQYHFGDREGMLRAVLDRHDDDVESRRHALLDACESSGEPELRQLVGALVLPLSAKLDDDSGRAYLRILADIYSRQVGSVDVSDLSDEASLLRWRALIEPLLDEDAIRHHRRFIVMRFVVTELGRRAETGQRSDNRLFTSHLIDLACALLGAPLSEQTMRIAAQRNSSTVSSTSGNER